MNMIPFFSNAVVKKQSKDDKILSAIISIENILTPVNITKSSQKIELGYGVTKSFTLTTLDSYIMDLEYDIRN